MRSARKLDVMEVCQALGLDASDVRNHDRSILPDALRAHLREVDDVGLCAVLMEVLREMLSRQKTR